MTEFDFSSTLSEVQTGETVHILGFHGGRAVNNRLASLGFTPGVEVTMIQNYNWGPLIVIVRGTHVALGRHEARKIIVKRSGNEFTSSTQFTHRFFHRRRW